MIIIKSRHEIDIMREAAKVTGEILRSLNYYIKPGMSTMGVNRYVEETIYRYGMIPTFKGYGGFPAGACISVNEEVVHGIPSEKRILKEGDIVSVDTGTTYRGYASDAARTYGVGEISREAQDLIDAARGSFFAGMEYARRGFRLSDISHAIQTYAENKGFSVIRDYVGHGIGHDMHEDPQIPNYGEPGKGPRLVRGMTFAIEPMICQGSCEVETLLDDWTVVTCDRKLAAHYENTIVINDGEPELLTL